MMKPKSSKTIIAILMLFSSSLTMVSTTDLNSVIKSLSPTCRFPNGQLGAEFNGKIIQINNQLPNEILTDGSLSGITEEQNKQQVAEKKDSSAGNLIPKRVIPSPSPVDSNNQPARDDSYSCIKNVPAAQAQGVQSASERQNDLNSPKTIQNPQVLLPPASQNLNLNENSTEKSTNTLSLINNAKGTGSPTDENSSNISLSTSPQIVPQIQNKIVDSSVTDRSGNVPAQPALISATTTSVSNNVVDSKGQIMDRNDTGPQTLNTPAKGSGQTTPSSLKTMNNSITATSIDQALVPNQNDKPISSNTRTNQSQLSSPESTTPGEGDKAKNIGDEAAALTSETPSEIINSINQLNSSDLDSIGKIL